MNQLLPTIIYGKHLPGLHEDPSHLVFHYNWSMITKSGPIILAFVTDLFFVSRLESAAQKLGVEIIFWDQADRSPDLTPGTDRLQKALARYGNRPLKLILLDLSAPGFPWESWLKALANLGTTSQVPVVAFGSHVNVEILKQARDAGASEALAKSRFTANLLKYLEKYLRDGTD